MGYSAKENNPYEDTIQVRRSSIKTAGCLRLIENVLAPHLACPGRHDPVHRVPHPVPENGGADRGKNRDSMLLNIGIGRERKGIRVLVTRLHIFETHLRIHRDDVLRNCGGLYEMGPVRLMLQTLQIVPIPLLEADPSLQQFASSEHSRIW